MNRIIAVAVLAACGVTVGAISAFGGSSPQPFAAVAVPAGPELTSKQVQVIAQKGAESAGDAGASIAIGHGTLRQAMQTVDPGSSEPATEGQLGAMMSENVVLIVERGHFALTGAFGRRGAIPVGETLDLIIDSHTGNTIGRALPISQEEGAVKIASADRIAVHSIAARRRTGILSGRVVVSGGPVQRRSHRHRGGNAVGYPIFIRHGTVVTKTVTGRHGFRVYLRPGRYVVEARPGDCLRQVVRVHRNRTTHVTVRCSIL